MEGTNSISNTMRPCPWNVTPMGNPALKLSAMVVLVPATCVTNGKTTPRWPPTPPHAGAATVSPAGTPALASLAFEAGAPGLLAGAGCAMFGWGEAAATAVVTPPLETCELVLMFAAGAEGATV